MVGLCNVSLDTLNTIKSRLYNDAQDNRNVTDARSEAVIEIFIPTKAKILHKLLCVKNLKRKEELLDDNSFVTFYEEIWFDSFLNAFYVKTEKERERDPVISHKLFNSRYIRMVSAALFINCFTHKSDQAGPQQI